MQKTIFLVFKSSSWGLPGKLQPWSLFLNSCHPNMTKILPLHFTSKTVNQYFLHCHIDLPIILLVFLVLNRLRGEVICDVIHGTEHPLHDPVGKVPGLLWKIRKIVNMYKKNLQVVFYQLITSLQVVFFFVLLFFLCYYTDPEAHYYTFKAFRSQSVSFRYQNVSFRSQNVSFRPQIVPFRHQSVSFRTKRSNCFVQSVPSKAFGSLREFSLSLSKWRFEFTHLFRE